MFKDKGGQKGISLVVMLALFVIIVVLRFIYTPDNVLSWDVFGYYLYLPSKFIYHDLDLVNQAWLNELIQKYHSTETLYQAFVAPNGQWVMKYSMGMAIMYMPFFFISHLLAGVLGFPPDGLSLPYQYGISVGGLIYTLIGLYFFRKILLNYFDDRISALLLILIVLGTNYINQSSVGNLAPHNFLFTLIAAMVWFTIKWHEKQRWIFMILTGLIIGMITLIRPTEGVCIILPLVWGIKNKQSLLNKIKTFNANKLQLLTGVLCIIIVLFPQFYYWKRQTGSYFFYSYSNPGEGLDFLSPHVINFLFSFRKGWFVYTPLAIFFLLGLITLYKKKRDLFYPIFIYFIINLYLISSWSCWWYAGGCYSQRAVVSSYVLLALPLGFLVLRINELKFYKKTLIYLLFFVLVILNIFQFWQFHNDILKGYGMTGKYYFAIFGKTKIPEGSENLLLVSRSFSYNETMPSPENFNKKIIGEFNFTVPDVSKPDRYVKDIFDTAKYCFVLDSSCIYSPGLDMKYKNITGEYYAWIKASVEIFIPNTYNETLPALVVTFDHGGKVYKYATRDFKYEDGEKREWKKISLDYQTPEVRDVNDCLKVYVWHRGRKPVYVKNLKIEAYDPKI